MKGRAENMKFEKEIVNDYSKNWFSGRYKIVIYSGEKNYYAFFKPLTWKYWGNSCECNRVGGLKVYKTLALAKAACIKHFETFGDKPKPNDTIEYERGENDKV